MALSNLSFIGIFIYRIPPFARYRFEGVFDLLLSYEFDETEKVILKGVDMLDTMLCWRFV